MNQTIRIKIRFFYNDHDTSTAEIKVNLTDSIKKVAKQWCQAHHCEFVDFRVIESTKD